MLSFRRVMNRVAVVLMAIVSMAIPWAGADEVAPEAILEGRLVEVTVYQGQALVTREVAVPGDEAGLRDIVVTNLPDQILPGSIYAEPSDGLEVRSVRYRTRPVEEDVREEVRTLDAQIRALADDKAAVQRARQLLGQREAYLQGLQGFTTATAKAELENGVLDADTLIEITEFVFTQRETDGARELELAREERRIDEEIDLLNRQRQKITQGSAKTVRQAVVFVAAERPGAVLRLRYLVAGASWSPSYNLRAGTDRKDLVVEYNASVQQMSGEDWGDVAMTLSTATPSLLATPPKLEPLAIRLGDGPARGGPKVAVDATEYERLKRELGENRDKLSRSRSQLAQADASFAGVVTEAQPQAAATGQVGGGMGGGGARANDSFFDVDGNGVVDARLNYFANELQILDFNSGTIIAGKKLAAPPSEGVSVSYRLAGKTSLPSRSDQQLIQIARLPLTGEFYRVAAPVLSSYVYEEAKLVNTGNVVMLAGPASTFIGEEFVGRGAVPTVAVGESFTVGLGIDSSLRATRELVSREETIQGGNRIVDFVYRLDLENFADAAAEVQLVDRIPVVGEDDIKITMVKSDKDLAEYEGRAADRKSGILRWGVEVAPAKRMAMEYTLRIEYDKELSIVGMPARQ